ncbi:MAG: SPASM domain-containing protein, partial [Acutalibacteraceae bacterium]
DFYCLDEWLLGNINDISLKAMALSSKAEKFILESLSVPEKCRKCPYFKVCRAGGCKRNNADRDYCEAYKSFFGACMPLFRVFINERKT